jgi:cytoskeletal protein RodZ
VTGERLKERRESLQLDLKEISDLLRIKFDYLEAIERNEIEKLPFPVYTIGYIRIYADYLHIDPDPIIEHFSKHMSQPNPPAIMPIAIVEKKRMKHYLLVPVALLSAIFLFIFFTSSGERSFLTEPVQYDASPEKNTAFPAKVLSADTQADSAESTMYRDEQILERKHDDIAGTSSDQQQAQSDRLEHILEIHAKDVTWISLDSGAHNAREILFQPGDSKKFTFFGKTVLKIGNAGGIRLTLDGKDLGTPGEPGSVLSLSIPSE